MPVLAKLAHLEGSVQLVMVAVEQVEHHSLQGIRRQQAMVGPKQPGSHSSTML